nr:MAG TPA: hypothetical protein [Caudoviricetes sp.]
MRKTIRPFLMRNTTSYSMNSKDLRKKRDTLSPTHPQKR